MVLKVYVDLLSEPCRSVIIFLKHTEIPYEVVTVDLINDDQKKPEYMNKFPLALVPGIQDGDFALAESVAIYRYLTAKYPDKVPDFLYPKDVEKRAKVDEYLAWHHTGTRKGLGDVLMNEVLLPVLQLPVPSEEQQKKDIEQLNATLDKVENAFLKDKKYLTGDEANLADVVAVTEMMESIATGRDVTEGRPKLKAYVDRVKKRFNPVFDEVHAHLIAWGKTLK